MLYLFPTESRFYLSVNESNHFIHVCKFVAGLALKKMLAATDNVVGRPVGRHVPFEFSAIVNLAPTGIPATPSGW